LLKKNQLMKIKKELNAQGVKQKAAKL